MSGQHIVVLGGTGFVGHHLVPVLQRHGHRITVLSRNRQSGRRLAVLPRVEVVNEDPYDPARLAARFAGADAVINLVGILNERGSDGSGFRRAHVDLTRGVIDACERAGVRRLLQMSALNAGRGRSHYLQSRGEAEALVRESALDWTIFQPSVIFGPGDGLFMRFASLLALAPMLPLARPNARFAPVYVGDVAAAFAQALVDRRTIGRSYELYGPDVMSLKQIVEYTARHLGLRRVVLPLPDPLGRLQAAVMDFVPGKPFSSDNYKSLLIDSVGGVDGLFALGIDKTPVSAVVPRMLAKSSRQALLDRSRRGD